MNKKVAWFFILVLLLIGAQGYYITDYQNRISALEETNAALCYQVDQLYNTLTTKMDADKEIHEAILVILVDHEGRIEKKKFMKTGM
jgi:hypothetical protein